MPVDPAALQVMRLSSELVEARTAIRAQRRQIWALAAGGVSVARR
jgi:hypothetical protein